MLLKHLKLRLGNLLLNAGWDLRPSYKLPLCSADLVGMGLALIRQQRGSEPIRVLQVGAFDGVTADPLRRHIGSAGVEAALLEPQPGPFAKLVSLYHGQPDVHPLNVAIADYDGRLAMWAVDSKEGSTVASAHKTHSVRFGIPSSSLEEIEVECVTPRTVLRNLCWPQLDFLQVDVEGQDWFVVRQFLELSSPPTVINFEIIHLDKRSREESWSTLHEHGYQVIDWAYDRFALKSVLLSDPVVP